MQKGEIMRKMCILPIILVLLNVSFTFADSYVWLKNNTPLSWSIKLGKYIARKGKKLQKGKDWKINKKSIAKWDAWSEKDDALLLFKKKDGEQFWNFELNGNLDNVKLPKLDLSVGTVNKKMVATLKGSVGKQNVDIKVKEKERPIAVYSLRIKKGEIKGLDRDYELNFTLKMDGGDLYVDIYAAHPYVFPSTKGNANKINVVAYNVYFINAPGVGRGRDKRVKFIPKKLRDADVVIFCEAFDDGVRRELLEGMKKVGFKYSTQILGAGYMKQGRKDELRNKPLEQSIINFSSPRFSNKKDVYSQGGEGEPKTPTLFMDGGIIIVSKYPIKKAVELVYEKGTSWDKLAHKGAVYAQINKDGKDYHVFGTHPQAPYGAGGKGEKLPQKTLDKIFSQFKRLKQFIGSQEIPKNEPVIVGGDFNIDKYPSTKPGSYEKVLKILNAVHPENIGFPYSADNTGTLDRKKEDARQLLDHVVYINGYQKPKKSFNEVMVFRTKIPWDKKKAYDLSDHYAVLGYFDF